MTLLEQALEFSKNYHKDHTRLTGELVSDHCQRVVQILKDEGIEDEKLLVVASLHHVLKYDSSQVMLAKLTEVFGAEISALLSLYHALTLKKVKRHTDFQYNEKLMVQTFLNLAGNMDLLVIRLADKLANLISSFTLDSDARTRLAQRALYIYAPIARLVGLSGFLAKFEEQSFKILYPADYYRVHKMLKNIEPEAAAFFKDAELFVKAMLQEQGIDCVLKFRIKRPFSVFKKERRYIAQGRNLEEYIQAFPDIVAMRVIVNTVEQCYLVDTLLRSIWHTFDEHYEDLIAHPRPSGYKSIHTVFKVSDKFNLEVQIRTHEMHEYNENGGASHIFYKAGDNFKANLERDPDWLKKLNYWEKDIAFDTAEGTKEKPFSTKIYTFTPKGDIIELDRGATVIDFAYAVHEDIGRNFTGCLVNGSIAKASQVLNDGDVIEIKASKKQKLPSRDWLEFVKTSKARNHIKKELKI